MGILINLSFHFYILIMEKINTVFETKSQSTIKSKYLEVINIIDKNNSFCRECQKNINTKNSFRHYKEIHLKTLECCPYCFLGIKRLTPHLNNNCKIYKKQKNIENNNKLFRNQAQPENNININKNNEIIIDNTFKDTNNIFFVSSIDKENAIELEFNFNQKLFDKLFEIYNLIQFKKNLIFIF